MLKKLVTLLVCCGAAAAVCAAETQKSFPDIFPKRQINDSWRTIELPAGTDTGKLALFELKEGKLTDRAVPFRIFKGASGEVILKFKVPGLNPGQGGGVAWKDGKAKITGAYNLPCKYVIHTPGPVWYGGKARERELPDGKGGTGRQDPEQRHAEVTHDLVQHEMPRIGVVPPLLRPRREPIVDSRKEQHTTETPCTYDNVAPSGAHRRQVPCESRQRAKRTRHHGCQPEEKPACEKQLQSIFSFHAG